MAESIQTGKVEEKDIECLEIPKEQNRLPCDSKQILNLKVALRSSDMWQNPFLRATLIWSLVLDDTFLVRCWKDLSKMNLHNHPPETAASYKTSPTWVWAAFPCTYNKLSFISAGTSLPAFPPWPSHNVAAALSVLALHCSHPGLLWWVETTEVPALVAHRWDLHLPQLPKLSRCLGCCCNDYFQCDLLSTCSLGSACVLLQ